MGIGLLLLGLILGGKYLLGGFVVSFIFVQVNENFSSKKKLLIIIISSVVCFVFGFFWGINQALKSYISPKLNAQHPIAMTKPSLLPNYLFKPERLNKGSYMLIRGKKPRDSEVFSEIIFSNSKCTKKFRDVHVTTNFSTTPDSFELHIPHKVSLTESCFGDISEINVRAKNQYADLYGFANIRILVAGNSLFYQQKKKEFFLKSKTNVKANNCGAINNSVMVCNYYVDGELVGGVSGGRYNNEEWFSELIIEKSNGSYPDINYDIIAGKHYNIMRHSAFSYYQNLAHNLNSLDLFTVLLQPEIYTGDH
ncbi:hypothetical protein BCT63_21000 [Vibrio kanaloae]|uniref:Uncharacterized protein n=1 Tax=Vibrio kanaloae TaxID=170673 RepID=A0A4U1YTL9_9VIBR|nr:hypothetical protein [Vibrio kanaloae]PMM08623.1 hypothetical protein BCT63_21000 [Vibrio kanaloae]TKF24029.1 hypothetical protein FCV50_23175 [Vibrio kanaloae]